jgi:putative ABC transport system permease protein
MVSELPMSGNRLDHDFLIEGRPPIAKGEEPSLYSRSVTKDYLKVMQIPVLQGREFSEQDRASSPMVGIINEAAAREHFPDEDPIGKRIRWARSDQVSWITIVGVAQDIRHFGFDRDEMPAVYTLYEQQDQPWKRWMVLVVRSQEETSALLRAIKEKLATVDNQIPVTEVATMTQVMSSSLATQRFNMTLLGIFAALAFLLAMIGIYGVISFSVSQRTHEIGIRMALGAKTGDVLQLILKQGLLLAVIGAGLGIVGAFALTRLMESLLFGVSARDPLTFTMVFLLLVAVALVACLVPARRAAKTDPMIALRYQ